MATIGELAVNVVARLGKFQQGMLRAQSLATRFARTLHTTLGVTGVGSTAGLTAATIALVRSNEQLEQSMNRSLAIMGNVSEVMRNDMTEAAIAVSSTTTASAKEAADAYFFLASAGMNAAQSIKALPTVAKFAQAGNFNLARATDLLTDAQSALGLSSEDALENQQNLVHVGDVLTKANTLANASVEQFSEALTNKAGAALRNVGKDIEEGVAVLAAFADQGLKGAEAGTAFGIVMRDLQTKALANAAAFKRAGVAVFDSSGEMNNLSAIIADVEQRVNGLSDAQNKAALIQLGFSDKSVAYLQTLIGTSEKIEEYEKGLREAGGTMEDVASKQLTDMEKATNKLAAAWQNLGRETGPVARLLAEETTAIAEALEGLSVLLDEMDKRDAETGKNVVPNITAASDVINKAVAPSVTNMAGLITKAIAGDRGQLSQNRTTLGRFGEFSSSTVTAAGDIMGSLLFGRSANRLGSLTEQERAAFVTPETVEAPQGTIEGAALDAENKLAKATEQRIKREKDFEQFKAAIVNRTTFAAESAGKSAGDFVGNVLQQMQKFNSDVLRRKLLFGDKAFPTFGVRDKPDEIAPPPEVTPPSDLQLREAGTAEAFTALRRNLGGNVMKDQLRESKEQTKRLNKIEENTRPRETEPLLSAPA